MIILMAISMNNWMMMITWIQFFIAMEKLDVHQPIKTILDGSNYVIWSQEMSSFLKGRRLWRYVTGDIAKPVKQSGEDDTKYADRLEDWESKHHQILTWIRNTSAPSIKVQFGRFETAKSVWDFLAKRYSITDIAHQYQLLETLSSMRQASGQPVNDFLALMHSIWDQLALSEPQWDKEQDAEKFITYRDKIRVMQFLMALDTPYEPVRSSLLHREVFPSLETAVAELLSEETRLRLLKPSSVEQVATNVVMAASASVNSDKTCRYCKSEGHFISKCPKLRAKQNNRNKSYGQQSNLPMQSAAVTDAMPPSISLSDLQAFIDQANRVNSNSALSTDSVV